MRTILHWSLAALVVIGCLANSAQASDSSNISLAKRATFRQFVYLAPLKKGSLCATGRSEIAEGLGDIPGPALALCFVDDSEDKFINSISDRLSTVDGWRHWNRNLSNRLNELLLKINERIDADDKLAIARVRFVVTNNGHIEKLLISNYAGDPKFDSLIRKAVEELEGDPKLHFPDKSRTSAVVKTGRFVQNFGESLLQKKGGAQTKPEPRIN